MIKVLSVSFLIVLLAACFVACDTKYIASSQFGTVIPTAINLSPLEKPVTTPIITSIAASSPSSPFTSTATSTPTPTNTPTPIVFPTPFGGGQYILFTVAMAGSKSQGISEINSDGSDTEFKVPDLSWERRPTWSPDGSKIAIVSDYYYSGSGELYIADTSGNYTKLIDIGYQYSWSPDSTQIAFNKADEKAIFVIDVDGKNLHQLTGSELSVDGPVWSPDGRQIAFYATSKEDHDDEIYVLSLDDKSVRQLTKNETFDSLPQWSSDGKHIAFLSRDDFYSTQGEIYVMDTDGNNLHNVSNYEDHYSCFDWSPDGKRIIFTSWARNSNLEIYSVDVDGNNLQNLTNHEASDGGDGQGNCSFDWSPDGTKIVFTSDRGDADLYVMNADGSDVHALVKSDEQTDFFKPVWQPSY